MKLRTKILMIFAATLLVNIFIVYFGLTFILDSLSTKLMKKQAQSIALFLQHRIAYSLDNELDPQQSLEQIKVDLDITKHISDQEQGFQLKDILLIQKDYTSLIGYPSSGAGISYAGHKDITDAFVDKDVKTVVETSTNPDGTKSKDIDVVAFFTTKNSGPMVLEVKLDFAQSIRLLEAQYATIEIASISIAIVLLFSLLGLLLIMISRTAIQPVIRVTQAMHKVSEGNLDILLDEKSKDEFGLLAGRFNIMVSGLKEKLRLSKYVSKSTINAVKESLGTAEAHIITRREAVIFFSDIRGFTTYSESRDPQIVITTLNKILTIQSDIIRQFGGDVDKFVGDEVMAVFEDGKSAINAALSIQKQMELTRASLDGLHIGIGIHIGEVMQGDVGSSDMKDFTVIGDNVNTAARLESVAAKDEILISEALARSGSIRHDYLFRAKGALKLKGKETVIKTYLVVQKKIPD